MLRVYVLNWMLLVAMFACAEDTTNSMTDTEIVIDAGQDNNRLDPDDLGINEDVGVNPDAHMSSDVSITTSDELFDPEHLIQVEVEITEDDWALSPNCT